MVRASLVAAATLVAAQSAAHLTAALSFDHVNSIVTSTARTSIPDVASTIVIVLAAVGAAALGRRRFGLESVAALLLAAIIAFLAAEDLLHLGVASTPSGLLVLASAFIATALLAVIGSSETPRVR